MMKLVLVDDQALVQQGGNLVGNVGAFEVVATLESGTDGLVRRASFRV